MGIEEEVELMNKSFNEGINTDPPGTQAPGTQPPPTDPPGTDAPGTEPPGTEAPSTEAPTTEAPVEDERYKSLEEENEKLRKKLAEKDEPKPTAAPSTEAPLSLEDVDFLGDKDLDELTRDPKAFNALLNEIYKRGVGDTRRLLGEGVLRSIPDIVKNNIVTMGMLKEASDKFYVDNEDLKPFKKIVGAVFEELISESPDKRYDELIPDLEKEVRSRLELHKKATKQPENPNPPRLPRKKGRAERGKEKPNVSPIEAEIDKMNETLGR